MKAILVGRLLLLAILGIIPAFHPGILRFSDPAYLVQSFLLLPGAVVLGFLHHRLGQKVLVSPNRIFNGRIAVSHLLAAAAIPLVFLIFGINATSLRLTSLWLYGYISMYLAVEHGILRIMYVDLFYFAYILIRLLGYGRVSDEMLQASRGFNTGGIIILISGFISYGILIYRHQFSSRSRSPRGAELAGALGVFTTMAVLIALLIPGNSVSNPRVFNGLNDIIEPRLRPLNRESNSLEQGGNLQGGGGEDGQEGQEGREGEVYVMSPDSWGNQGGSGEGSLQNQYMVMVVSSPASPVYLADRYYNHLDPARGFYSDPEFQLNRLPRAQYLESWVNPDPVPLRNRSPVWIDVYSTIRDKVSSYQPLEIEPSVMDTRYYPLSFSYRARSLISNLSIHGIFPRSGELTSEDRENLSGYLEVELSPPELARYREHLDSFMPEDAEYMERIIAILNHYREYQYELGFTDDVSIPAISDFLFNHRSGDCTEFSNSAAILARMAGIPSRVVTGYLVSDGLQTNSHKQALAQLREQFPPLEEEDPSDLYLVTTVHRHSWAQFYLPVYGWVDFEATSQAIPPQGSMDPNSLNVVIPDLQERTVYNRRVPIPWELLGSLAVIIGLLTAAGLYGFRWSRILLLGIISRGSSETALKALYRLLLVRLHARGWHLKSPDRTPMEYAREYPELETFARLYTRAIYSPRVSGTGVDPELKTRLKNEYRRLLKGGGPGQIFVLLFGLKDMRYL